MAEQRDKKTKACKVHTRAEVMSKLSTVLPKLKTAYGVERLQLFGSASRDELHEKSDVDVLVHFDAQGATLDRYFELKWFLEDVLGRSVDVGTLKSVRPLLYKYIEEELRDVA